MVIKRKKRNIKENIIFKRLNFIILFLIIILGVTFLTLANNLAARNYKVDNLKQLSDKLNDNYQKKQLQIIKLQSLDNINKDITALKMVKTNNIKYLTVKPQEVAKR